MRRGLDLGVLLVFVVVGYGLAGVIASPTPLDPSQTPAPGARTSVETTTTIVARRPTTTTSPEPSTETFLLWASGGLPPDFVAGLERRFDTVSVVRGDVVEMDIEGDGWLIPLDALAIDPAAHSAFDPGGSLSRLAPANVVLGESSAELRNMGTGDRLQLGDSTYEVAGVVPDEVVGAAEIVFARDDASSPVTNDRFALVSTDLDRTEFEEAARELYEGPAPLRIRTDDETPWLRHGDAVLPQIFIKRALGEFSYRDRAGGRFTQDPAFVEEHIVAADVPILGTVTCHAIVVEMVRGALGELVEEGLGHLVDPSEFAGCWNPRFIRTITGDLAGISRHAWGAALDVNAASNPMGSTGDQDPRLVEVMQRWGFTWGGDWLVPDAMHFEYGIPPGG